MYPRYVARRIRENLTDTRVVLLCGPRQSGKTTLVRQIASENFRFVTLDDPTFLNAAQADPVGFVRDFDKAVIDEVQRAPRLMLALKLAVDADPRPGRFLLTGSADLLTIPRVADSLAGRMALVRLLPLAQSELRRSSATFLDKAFAGMPPSAPDPAVGNKLVEIILAGGYPEALARSGRRRRNWHLDYIDAIMQRDIRDIARIGQLSVMPRLLRVLAEHAGQLVNYSGFGGQLGMNHVTTQKYISVLENLYLLRVVQPWHSNRLKRLIKSPKLQFLDSGLLAALRGLTPETARRNRAPLGAIVETFVLSELLKIASWAEERYRFSYFRDKDGNEVDIVIEDEQGRVIGIEAKLSATVSRSDFSGLRRLAAASGDQFVMGLILCDHEQTIPFGNQFVAAPIASLWS
ncbi:MAG: ATP-binding protein [Gammaproteobacteria bacterium]|nr:ATP-binding protein [Gammaproteobacteria bacterium]MCY4341059.1 ATP-binding protein [Gammaproteobacteria bacterium]